MGIQYDGNEYAAKINSHVDVVNELLKRKMLISVIVNEEEKELKRSKKNSHL